jgi:hypothetical protein
MSAAAYMQTAQSSGHQPQAAGVPATTQVLPQTAAMRQVVSAQSVVRNNPDTPESIVSHLTHPATPSPIASETYAAPFSFVQLAKAPAPSEVAAPTVTTNPAI